MCIMVVALNCHPAFPFIFAHNREERADRIAGEDMVEADSLILCSRDLESGGMVLGLHAPTGRFTALTNVRTKVRPARGDVAKLTSRGKVVEYLVEHGFSALDELISDLWLDGFHVVGGQAYGSEPSVEYGWLAPEEDGSLGSEEWKQHKGTLKPGVFAVSNENPCLGDDWPKTKWLKNSVESFLKSLPEDAQAKDVHQGLSQIMSVAEIPGIDLPSKLPNFFKDTSIEVAAQKHLFLTTEQTGGFCGTISQRIFISEKGTKELHSYYRSLQEEGMGSWQRRSIPWMGKAHEAGQGANQARPLTAFVGGASETEKLELLLSSRRALSF